MEDDIFEEEKEKYEKLKEAREEFSLTKKIKDEKSTIPQISVRKKDHRIKYKRKGVGKFNFNYLQRNILFSLLGMPVEFEEVNEIIDQPPRIMEENVSKLLKEELIENIGTVKKKKLRGDSQIHLFYLLTDKGKNVAEDLLKFFNEEYEE